MTKNIYLQVTILNETAFTEAKSPPFLQQTDKGCLVLHKESNLKEGFKKWHLF